MNENKIIVVEDEEDIAQIIKNAVEKENFSAEIFNDGNVFLNHLLKIKKPDFNLIILDIMLPSTSGTEILKQIRYNEIYKSFCNIPVIIVSAKNTETDKVIGFEFGADDYVSKPFSPKELMSRIKAVLKRTYTAKEPIKEEIISFKGIEIDLNKAQVKIDGVITEFTNAEFKILTTLLKRKGWVYERSKIIDDIWDGEKFVTDRTIDVHITHIRNKLKHYGNLIKTVRGIGYKIDTEE